MSNNLFSTILLLCKAACLGGLSQNEVYETLEKFRMNNLHLGEEIEDTILEVMDIVCGWCPEENKIWK